jgi:prepilin-type N-terminal cleavage/methylation domain-containing protein/prepilin-type processing-associated H-X9-DG protein
MNLAFHFHSPPNRRAFTLIELLVVIAIIAILASILLGVTQYSQDYDERMVTAYRRFPADVWINWQQFVQPYVKNTQIFSCPSDVKTGVNPQTSNPTPDGSVAPFHSSYVGNIQTMGSAECGTGVSLAAITNPSSTVFMTDGGSTVDLSKPITQWITTGRESNWLLTDPTVDYAYGGCIGFHDQAKATVGGLLYNIGGPVTRHLETSVVGFMDGHVKAMKADKWYRDNTPWMDPARGGS